MNRPWWVRPVAVTVALTALVVVFVTTSVVRDRTYACLLYTSDAADE